MGAVSGKAVIVTANSHRRHRIPGLAWAAAVVPFAAFFLVLLGGSPAHAADDDPQSGALLSFFGKTVSATTSIAADVTAPVVGAISTPVANVVPVMEQVTSTTTLFVAPVVTAASETAGAVVTAVSDTMTAVPIVGPTLGSAMDTAAGAITDTTGHLVDTVVDLTGQAPLAQLTHPILGLVGALPVVGDLVEDNGLVDLLDIIIGVVDDATDDAGSLIEQVLPPIVNAVDPDPGEARHPEGAEPGDLNAPAPGSPYTPGLSIFAGSAFAALYVDENIVTGPATPLIGTPPAHGPPAAPSSSSSAHVAGSSFHEGARTHAAPFTAPGDSERTPPAPGDDLPTSPVADTDVSPD